MRPSRMIVSAIVLCVGASGCRMAAQITHNLVYETCLYTDEVNGKVHYCLLASSALKTYQAEHPDCASSADFGKGFKRGYASYLEYGGDCCNAHPVPPHRYWKYRHETPEGRAATVAWLEGYRAGATAAKASGYRELIVVPIDLKNQPPHDSPLPVPYSPPLANGTLGTVMPAAPPAEELPVPRAVPDTPVPTPPTSN